MAQVGRNLVCHSLLRDNHNTYPTLSGALYPRGISRALRLACPVGLKADFLVSPLSFVSVPSKSRGIRREAVKDNQVVEVRPQGPPTIITSARTRTDCLDCRVRPHGPPISSIFGHLYLEAGNITECFVGGRIAGRNAALEEAWS